ncbi:hypothetical protein Tco_0890577 [Tanacetum coccineum]|uniref:Uncharacterized protein n=1 Tax=Tanacetum coccineum TaxID=301880 RepID=A0ABQ5C0H0_9ASTR
MGLLTLDLMGIVNWVDRTILKLRNKSALSWLSTPQAMSYFCANEIYEKDEKLKRYRRIGMKAVKEKEQLQKTVDSWKDSSKNLWRLIDSGMSSNSKVGLGFEIQSNNEGVPHPLSGGLYPKPQDGNLDASLYVYESLSEPNEMSKSRLEVTNEKDVSALKSKEVEPSCAINHANKLVPRSVQLNTGRTNINSVRPKVNSVRPKVNAVSPKVNTSAKFFHKPETGFSVDGIVMRREGNGVIIAVNVQQVGSDTDN